MHPADPQPGERRPGAGTPRHGGESPPPQGAPPRGEESGPGGRDAQTRPEEPDPVDDASADSFPASDPPAHSGTT